MRPTVEELKAKWLEMNYTFKCEVWKVSGNDATYHIDIKRKDLKDARHAVKQFIEGMGGIQYAEITIPFKDAMVAFPFKLGNVGMYYESDGDENSRTHYIVYTDCRGSSPRFTSKKDALKFKELLKDLMLEKPLTFREELKLAKDNNLHTY